MTRYFIFIDHRNKPYKNGMKPFESLEKAWQLCPKNYILAIGTQEQLLSYYDYQDKGISRNGQKKGRTR